MDIKPSDLAYLTALIVALSTAILFLLWIVIRLLKEILAELRNIRQTIHSTASSDIELRIFGGDE